jgi:hypothetical protein
MAVYDLMCKFSDKAGYGLYTASQYSNTRTIKYRYSNMTNTVGTDSGIDGSENRHRGYKQLEYISKDG